MKKVFKVLGFSLLTLVVLALAGAAYLKFILPDVEAATVMKVEPTPDRVTRGAYLANNVAVCMDCHSKRDWTQFAGPMAAGTEGMGGEPFDRQMGFPGNFYSKNITPYNLKHWTDGEIFRAITTGVSKDGKALFPVMPYHYYGKCDPEDIHAIIAYLRTLPEQKNDVPESEPDFPMSLILNTIPAEAHPQQRPSPADSVAYGGYLVTMSGCVECHTKADKGQIIPGQEFAGGRAFEMPFGTLRAPNITPDPTGIGSWTRDAFIAKFKSYAAGTPGGKKLGLHDYNTIMPWTQYGKMTESDLASIYHYLRSLQPKQNVVEKVMMKTASR